MTDIRERYSVTERDRDEAKRLIGKWLDPPKKKAESFEEKCAEKRAQLDSYLKSLGGDGVPESIEIRCKPRMDAQAHQIDFFYYQNNKKIGRSLKDVARTLGLLADVPKQKKKAKLAPSSSSDQLPVAPSGTTGPP